MKTRAALLGQRVEQLAQRDALGVVDVRRGALGRLHRIVEVRLLDAAFAPPQRVVAGVDEDAVHPGRERRLAGVRRRRAVDLEERLLDRILGIGNVAEVVPGDALHPLAETLVDLFKDPRVPAAHPWRGGGRPTPWGWARKACWS